MESGTMLTAKSWRIGLVVGVGILIARSIVPAAAQDRGKTEIVLQTSHTGDVYAVVSSPDGNLILTASTDHTIKLWDAATGTLVRTFEGHSDWVTSVAFSADGNRTLSGSHDGTIKLWDTAT